MLVMVMVLVASQWTSLHARSMPGDYDTQQFQQRGFKPLNSEYQSSQFDTQSNQASFAGQDNPWDAESFTYQDVVVPTPPTHQNTYNYEGNTFASTEAPLPFDTFIDSPETVQDNGASFAHEQVVHSQAEYENDRVFFDTSDANTVYRANHEYVSSFTATSSDFLNKFNSQDASYVKIVTCRFHLCG